MQLSYNLDTYLKEADNIYDLIGNCFGALCDTVTNHQLFVSQYLDEGVESNPNLKKLKIFSEKIMEIMKMYKPSEYPDILNAILASIAEINLEDYLDDKENQLTVIYCVLAAIDASAASWKNKWIASSMGPLDRQKKTGYRVYSKLPDALNLGYANAVGRGRICPSTFFEQFENFRFIDSSKWGLGIDVPQIKFIPQVHKDLDFDKSEPGKHNDMIAIERVGLLLPSICRDFEFPHFSNCKCLRIRYFKVFKQGYLL